MGDIPHQEIIDYIEAHIGEFHERRIQNLSQLQLKRVLKRKNLYLFRAKNINVAAELVKAVLEAHLSSQEEGIFGDFLEGLAIFICEKAYNGRKSSAEGIDLEFEADGTHHIVVIKSGPNWGNSRQIAIMRQDFRRAARILRTSGKVRNVLAVNGCCYGRNACEDQGDYLKLCGQSFWEFISGKDTLYTDIIEPLGYKAKERNDRFLEEYGAVLNRFTRQFIEEFCEPSGQIIWEEVVRFNSARRPP